MVEVEEVWGSGDKEEVMWDFVNYCEDFGIYLNCD